MLTQQQEILIATLPETEYWHALVAAINEELEPIEQKENETGGKICDEPLIEDFRTQLGIKIGLKRVLRKPQEMKEKLNR